MALIWDRVDKFLLNEQFVADLDALLGPDEDDWYVTYGWRSHEEQAELHEKFLEGGPKAAPEGESPHEYGLAVDLSLDGDGKKARLQPDWNESHPGWVRLRKIVDKHPRLRGGWHFSDGDHIEKVHWRLFKP